MNHKDKIRYRPNQSYDLVNKEMRRCPACSGSGVVIYGEKGYKEFVAKLNQICSDDHDLRIEN